MFSDIFNDSPKIFEGEKALDETQSQSLSLSDLITQALPCMKISTRKGKSEVSSAPETARGHKLSLLSFE